ncbi:MAG: hypothetical protein Q8M35_03460 [Pseudohongiella sp.]|nr:hypothetical protein [Pseudohongiella sp.]
MPSEAWLDSPIQNEELKDKTLISGWAINSAGVNKVSVLLDSMVVAETVRSVSREDVVTLKHVDFDPAAPLLGFAVEIDTHRFKNGQYQLSLELLTGAGERQRTNSRIIKINNE